MDIKDIIYSGGKSFGLELSNSQVNQFITYMELLKEWNQKINLTAITEDIEIVKKHFIDSISIIESNVIKDNSYIIDVGTGAGFPAIPLKIVKPDVKVVLLDSLNKRIKFLNEVIEKLGLEGIETIHGRAEEMGKNSLYREKFDIATARAVANMTTLSEYCIPYVKKGGNFIAMKGPSGYQELEEAKNAIKVLGGNIKEIKEVKIIDEDIKHNIIIVEKISCTPAKYPRKPIQMEKNPII